MKLQVCTYQIEEMGDILRGVACVHDFDVSDVKYILDRNGHKVKFIWDYRLINEPFGCYLDSGE